MDIELFLEGYAEGLAKDESLLLINGGATSTGAILFQQGGHFFRLRSHAVGVRSKLTLNRIDGPKTQVQLREFLKKYSR
jgi:hypothetical protein